VDKNRIYVTGLSMGGQGTWTLALSQPNRFAAIAPVCGWTDSWEVCKISRIPTWVFHGAKDNVVPVTESQEMVKALENCGAKEVKLTIYPEANHDSWTETYNNPELYNWLLSHSLKNN
jgi:predicted peptidase